MLNKKNTILIVDDERTLLSALVDKFTREGFVVSGAKNGKEGLSRALADHPDIILLDLIMPVMDGTTMLANLRKDPWGKDAKVIVLTNLSELEKAASRLQGVYDYLIKSDWELKDVVKKVKEGLEIKA
jgi:CheY-like chemotaxis protein